MEFVFAGIGLLYVLWLLSFIMLGDYKNVIPFTVAFVFGTIIVLLLAFLSPIAVIFSKTARKIAKEKISDESWK